MAFEAADASEVFLLGQFLLAAIPVIAFVIKAAVF